MDDPVEIPAGMSLRCRVCGVDVMDPAHKPEWCETTAAAVALRDVKSAAYDTVPREDVIDWSLSPFGAVEAGYDAP